MTDSVSGESFNYLIYFNYILILFVLIVDQANNDHKEGHYDYRVTESVTGTRM